MFDIIGYKVSVIPSQANVKEAFPRVLAMGCEKKALNEIGRLVSFAHESRLAYDPGVPGGAGLGPRSEGSLITHSYRR